MSRKQDPGIVTGKGMVLKGFPRLTREDWLATAKTALVASGIDDVKVDRLAKRMNVTRGSFYYHFKDRQDLVDALLRDWEVRNRVEIAQVRDRWAAAGPDLSEVVAIWLGEEAGALAFDLAIRHWARRRPPWRASFTASMTRGLVC